MAKWVVPMSDLEMVTLEVALEDFKRNRKESMGADTLLATVLNMQMPEDKERLVHTWQKHEGKKKP